MGITGILSAIAIPQYNRYRANAARGAFDATGSNIARAFQACISANPFTNCTSALSDIGVTCPECGAPATQGSKWCVDMKTKIGGDEFTSCVEVDGATGAIKRTYGATSKICWVEDGTTTGFQSTEDTVQVPLTTCLTNAECTGATTYCEPGTGGTCTSGTGICS